MHIQDFRCELRSIPYGIMANLDPHFRPPKSAIKTTGAHEARRP